jgi:NADH-quinone oxidoreductase subunit M
MGLLLFYLIIPLLAILAFLFSDERRYIRLVSYTAVGMQLVITILLILLFANDPASKGSDRLFFAGDIGWSRSLNIYFSVGVDSISIALLSMISLVALSTLLASGKIDNHAREYYILLFLMILGANGFFISASIFSMLLFTGISIVPVYLISCYRSSEHRKVLTTVQVLLVASGFAILSTGITGIYMNSAPDGNQMTFNIQEISTYIIPVQAQRVFFPMVFFGFAIIAGIFPFNIFLAGFLKSSHSQVSMLYSGILMNMSTYGALKASIYLMPEAAGEMSMVLLIIAAATVIYGIAGILYRRDLANFRSHIPGVISGIILFMMLKMNRQGITAAVILMIAHGLFVAVSPVVPGRINESKGKAGFLITGIMFFILVLMVPLIAMLAMPAWFHSAAGTGIQTILNRILSVSVL